MTSLNRLTLVLNASYEAIHVTSARTALKMVCKGKAIVEVVSPYAVKTAMMSFPIPSVIRLLSYRKVPRIHRSVSRKGILLRDRCRCQYCGAKQTNSHVESERVILTMDHVIPRSRGGASTWENLVAACKPCNNIKGDKTPGEAGLKLARIPKQITLHAKHRLLADGDENHSWDRYLFA